MEKKKIESNQRWQKSQKLKTSFFIRYHNVRGNVRAAIFDFPNSGANIRYALFALKPQRSQYFDARIISSVRRTTTNITSWIRPKQKNWAATNFPGRVFSFGKLMRIRCENSKERRNSCLPLAHTI